VFFIASKAIKNVSRTTNHKRPSNQILTCHAELVEVQSETAVSSIYKQNPSRMAEALEAIAVMLNSIQHLTKPP
jgi:hypothetical protein